MIVIKHKGSFKHVEKFFSRNEGEWQALIAKFEQYGREGVDALKAATPVDTGLTSESWEYKVVRNKGSVRIEWGNSNKGQGWFPIAINLQYGHGTRNGGWVEGRDYINPAMRPIFDKIADDAWQEVIKS